MNMSTYDRYSNGEAYNIKNVNIVFLTLANRTKASSRVRGFWLSEKMKSAVAFPLNVTNIYNNNKVFAKASIWVIQKSTSIYLIYLVKLLTIFNKKTAFDIDDYPSPNESEITLKNFQRMCKSVDVVFAGSPNLVKLCSRYNKNTHLLPTGIKLNNYAKKTYPSDREIICLGWIGNGRHYEKDLINILLEPLKNLSQEFELHLKIIGSKGCETLKSEFQSCGGIKTTFIDDLNWADASEVDKAMDEFDIGLYPLIENKINSYKCGFKALEYYAKGIPVVSSDVTMNKEIVLHEKTGFLARNSEEWYVYLKRLIENPELRQEMGNKGYGHVKEHFEISKIAKRFTEIIENN